MEKPLNPYTQGLDRIVGLYAKQYFKKDRVVKTLLITCPSVRMVLTEAYTVAKNQGRCEDITKLDQADKEALWQEAKEWTGSNDREILHDTCKAIIIIGSKL